MTVELAHPSTEPMVSRSPSTTELPRWWFLWTTPGRILIIGVVCPWLPALRELDDEPAAPTLAA